ncbi:hypothetical protein BHM03_00043814 [Ensete ventricosum]|uniref:Uncharacterized protein n=1 Tax=Ensete ventricosum TaxID=4639 RepID=A0A445MKK1_ENSVE|nr:hypothetical protein BHM03_00043814 [Ensete ventricosum]
MSTAELSVLRTGHADGKFIDCCRARFSSPCAVHKSQCVKDSSSLACLNMS